MSALAKAAARKILKEYCINRPEELNLEDILAGELIYLEQSDLQEEEGRIIYNENCGILRINKAIRELGHRRTVIAHELGHYKLHSAKKNICKQLDLLTHDKNKPQENEANIFASELLMPEEWIKNFTRGRKMNKNLLSDICEYFSVSISSAALRISLLHLFPIAVIMSKDKKVLWNSISNSFPFKWIPKGYKVNNNSYAYDLFVEMEKPDTQKRLGNVERMESNNKVTDSFEEVLADAWFWEDRNYRKNYFMYEMNIPMPRYNSVLTILLLKE